MIYFLLPGNEVKRFHVTLQYCKRNDFITVFLLKLLILFHSSTTHILDVEFMVMVIIIRH
jgi:hypothetical protein